MDINKKLFKRLKDYFKDSIKLSFVASYNVLFVTNDDRVYRFCEVKDSYSSIAYSSDESIIEKLIEKAIVDELSYKGIIDFKSGLLHTMARTIDGKVYVWGKNSEGVIGNGFENEDFLCEPKLNEYLKEFNIIDICCGTSHSMALTSSGDIYAWGSNKYGQIGDGSDINCQPIPKKMKYSENEKFKAITCGCFHSMALTEDGRVFSCGHNLCGQLGDGAFKNSNHLKPIKMNDILIEKISSGAFVSLLLSTDKEVYAFGTYNHNKDDSYQSIPIKVNFEEKIIDIATYYNLYLCAALSENGIFYTWGSISLREETVTEPSETKFKSFTDIFNHYFRISLYTIESILQFEDHLIADGSYEIHFEELKKLGEGAYGVVYKVKRNFDNKCYAVKKIKFKKIDEKEILRELELNSSILQFIELNLMGYYSLWLENNFKKINGKRKPDQTLTLYILMELCQQSLTDFLSSIKEIEFGNENFLTNLKFYTSCVIFTQILEGVHFLHKQNPPIIHKDLCPDNILIFCEEDDRTCVKIADFGLATFHRLALRLHELQKYGHLDYIAPEAMKTRNYDTISDIYSLGIILKDLFDIDSDDNLYSSSSFLESKYQNIIELYKKMTSDELIDRPNCEAILRDKDLWTLTAKEIFDEENNCHVFKCLYESEFQRHPFVFIFLFENIGPELANIDEFWKLASITRNPLMNISEKRKKCFTDKKWGLSIPHCINKLSESGFYLTENNHFIKCFHCSGILNNWAKVQNPWIEHAIHYPYCCFLEVAKGDEFIDECQKFKDGVKLNPTDEPINIHMQFLENRLKSFTDHDWDNNIPVSFDALAESGFYYFGKSNRVHCFHCAVGVYEWAEEDPPWVAHAKYSPNCHFLKLIKGQEFIDECRKLKQIEIESELKNDDMSL